MHHENSKIKNIDELIGDIQNIWRGKETDKCLFWSALANSYFENEHMSNSNNNFYSKISFYPNLIKYLTTSVVEKGDSPEIEITFFSTLLPRHYWNFPIPKRLINNSGDEENFFFSNTKEFLEKYREILCNSIKVNKIKLKRVLILGNKRFFFKNTHLFSAKDLQEDNKYYLELDEKNQGKTKEIPIPWSSIFNHEIDINSKEKIYSTGCRLLESGLWFGGNGDKPDNVQEIKEILNSRKFYQFSSNNSSEKKISLLNYYIQYLHSHNEAKVLIIKEDENHQSSFKIFDKSYSAIHKSKLKTESFNLDSAYIKIGKKVLILNTYMDTFNNTVKLKIIEPSNTDIFNKLTVEIDEFYNISKPLISSNNSFSEQTTFKVKTPNQKRHDPQ